MYFLLFFLLLVGPSEPADPHQTTSGSVIQSETPGAVAVDSSFSVFSTRYTYDWVAERQAWHRREATLQTALEAGDLVTTLVQQRRFGRNEVSGDVHYWPGLWGNAYGHVYASLAPSAQSLPRQSLGAELYEVVGGWELSGGYEWRRYYSANVHLMGLQIAWYVDNWYLRTRTSVIERENTWNVTQVLAARRYLGSPSTYVDGQVGYGRTVDLLQPDLPLQRSRGYFVSVRLRKFVTSTLGISLGGKYSNDVLRRAGASLGLLARW